jgi:histidinol-phosphatase (PHP family)
VAEFSAPTSFDRVLASLHSAHTDTGLTDVSIRYRDTTPGRVIRDYLAETLSMIQRFGDFEVLAHIDYPVRYWPTDAEPYDPHTFEDDYRQVLRSLATAGKALEVNTKVPLHPQILTWWRQEGGQTITFASDAHEPAALARGFSDAVALAQAAGFRQPRQPHELWTRA